MNCLFLQFRKRKLQKTMKMTICHLIKLIGCQIQVHYQNNCTVLITNDQSSKVCEHFSAFWQVIFKLIFQVRAAKNMQFALCWPPHVNYSKYSKFQESPTHFGFIISKECSGQISQKSTEFWYPINSLVWVNNAWSFSWPLLQLSSVELKKPAIHFFSEIYIC